MKKWLAVICLMLFLVSCSAQARQTETHDYQETKHMVLDILKTEDGKKSVEKMMEDQKFKEKIMVTDTAVTDAVDKALHNPKNQKQIQKVFQDPKVAANIAKVTQKEQEKLLKQLMKDPEYQKMLLDVMKNPDFEKQITDLLKTEPFRKQTMVIMTEALENPIFKEKYMDLMIKANEEALQSKKNGGGDSGSSGDGGGGQDGGGSQGNGGSM